MKYEIGDKIKIRSDLVEDKKYGGITCVYGMLRYLGKNARIMRVHSASYWLDVDKICFYWSEDMFENSSNLLINNLSMSLINKAKQLLMKEPDKSLTKANVIDINGDLTEEGRELYVMWRFKKDKKLFTDEIVKPLLEKEEDTD